MSITLTDGQQAFYDLFSGTIAADVPAVIVLKGYAGTGKSTLMRRLITDLPQMYETGKLLNPNLHARRELVLTATTNKACEALQSITGEPVPTIHSRIGAIVQKDYASGATQLKLRRGAEPIRNAIVIIDEASFIDKQLYDLILQQCQSCIVVFVGDPAQLLAVRAKYSPAFHNSFPTVEMTEIVRQAKDNPILELATRLRETVLTGKFFSLRPDGHYIRHLPQEQFNQELQREFTREDWSHNDSKVLAWTNKRVVSYNQGLRQLAKGQPTLQVGDYAINNSAVTNQRHRLRADQLVHISAMSPSSSLSYAGHSLILDNKAEVFMPANATKADVLKAMRKQTPLPIEEITLIEDTWVDLRAAYSCTINKSQGSTYRKTYIDLNDVGRCNNLDTLARLLYVGVSRASEQIVFTGDIV